MGHHWEILPFSPVMSVPDYLYKVHHSLIKLKCIDIFLKLIRPDYSKNPSSIKTLNIESNGTSSPQVKISPFCIDYSEQNHEKAVTNSEKQRKQCQRDFLTFSRCKSERRFDYNYYFSRNFLWNFYFTRICLSVISGSLNISQMKTGIK